MMSRAGSDQNYRKMVIYLKEYDFLAQNVNREPVTFLLAGKGTNVTIEPKFTFLFVTGFLDIPAFIPINQPQSLDFNTYVHS